METSSNSSLGHNQTPILSGTSTGHFGLTYPEGPTTDMGPSRNIPVRVTSRISSKYKNFLTFPPNNFSTAHANGRFEHIYSLIKIPISNHENRRLCRPNVQRHPNIISPFRC